MRTGSSKHIFTRFISFVLNLKKTEILTRNKKSRESNKRTGRPNKLHLTKKKTMCEIWILQDFYLLHSKYGYVNPHTWRFMFFFWISSKKEMHFYCCLKEKHINKKITEKATQKKTKCDILEINVILNSSNVMAEWYSFTMNMEIGLILS